MLLGTKHSVSAPAHRVGEGSALPWEAAGAGGTQGSGSQLHDGWGSWHCPSHMPSFRDRGRDHVVLEAPGQEH